MKKKFDPFDEDFRDKRPRRRKDEIIAAERDWEEKMLSEMRRILELYNGVEYINVSIFLEDIMMNSDYYTYIKRNLNTYFSKLNYVKLPAKTSDGRWKINGVNTHVYKKIEKPDLTLSQLKEYFK